MKKTSWTLTAALGLLIVMSVGCTKTHVLTTELSSELNTDKTYFFDQIEDQLPNSVKPEDKPTYEELMKFKEFVSDELIKQGLMSRPASASGQVPYEIRGAILSFSKGSGFLRFLFGELAGAASMTVSLELVETETDQVVFGGNFTQKVTSWLETRDEVYKRIAKDFAKTLKKQREGITGQKIEEVKVKR